MSWSTVNRLSEAIPDTGPLDVLVPGPAELPADPEIVVEPPPEAFYPGGSQE
jgi:hypothetical protein